MAAPTLYLYGTGGSTGAELSSRRPFYSTGTVHYVHYLGSNAYAGTDRTKPVATLQQAVTNSVAGDVIVLMDGHNEVISSTVTLNKRLLIIGEGSGNTIPRLTNAAAATAMLDITSTGVRIDNVYFPASTAVGIPRIRCSSTMFLLKAVTFECGPSDTGGTVNFVAGAGQVVFIAVRFASTATTVTAQPSTAISVASAMSDLAFEVCTFDGGTYGFSGNALSCTAAVTALYGVDVTFTGGADAAFASGTSGTFHVKTAGGTAKVVWTP